MCSELIQRSVKQNGSRQFFWPNYRCITPWMKHLKLITVYKHFSRFISQLWTYVADTVAKEQELVRT